MSSQAWRDRAACRGVNISVFFPEIPQGDSSTWHWRQARTYCEGCTVKADCLAFVLPFEAEAGRRNGMWAGMTPKERDAHTAQPLTLRLR